ncbi:protein of unknown function [Streptomyces sp. TLI_053]|uniref:DUF397 domain-containing protein n=1 Tax=Streptomyces sp. TLI_053 TaxID=1855352 RepID=UPI00087D056B|nr:DUF397 domain-containing protein [Streptomyces sp. TLI_053]SDT78875.1 protein of unknown function [Streptomyces sp. TLI_053]
MSQVTNTTGLEADFQKSSFSGGNENCIELATNLRHFVVVRDSKDPSGPELLFTSDAHTAFITAVASGEFDFDLF